MGNPVFVVWITGLFPDKPEILVEFLQMLLGGDPDRVAGEEAAAAPDAFPHQGLSQASPPHGRVDRHPADGGFLEPVAGSNQTQVGHEPALRVAAEEMPRMVIAAVGVQIGASLFYHKNLLAERQEIIQLVPRQRGIRKKFPLDFSHGELPLLSMMIRPSTTVIWTLTFRISRGSIA